MKIVTEGKHSSFSLQKGKSADDNYVLTYEGLSVVAMYLYSHFLENGKQSYKLKPLGLNENIYYNCVLIYGISVMLFVAVVSLPEDLSLPQDGTICYTFEAISLASKNDDRQVSLKMVQYNLRVISKQVEAV